MKPRNSYLEFLIEQFSPLGDITSKNMFGGHCLYCGGTVFALIAGNFLYLKADDENRPEYEARGLKAFQPPGHPGISMSYFEAPAEIFEDPDAMKHWAGAAVEASLRSKKTPRKRLRKTKS